MAACGQQAQKYGRAAVGSGLLAFVALLASADGAWSPAAAATINNRDNIERRIVIIRPASRVKGRQELTLKPGYAVSKICREGCVLRIMPEAAGKRASAETAKNDAGASYRLEGNEITSIEKGALYFDALSKPDPGDKDAEFQN